MSTNVAPTWPEWAVDENLERAWVRLDLEDRAEQVLAPALDELLSVGLARVGRVPLWLDRVDTEWAGDWLLRAVEPSSDPQDAVVYVEYDIVEACEPRPDRHEICPDCGGTGDMSLRFGGLMSFDRTNGGCEPCGGSGRRPNTKETKT